MLARGTLHKQQWDVRHGHLQQARPLEAGTNLMHGIEQVHLHSEEHAAASMHDKA